MKSLEFNRVVWMLLNYFCDKTKWFRKVGSEEDINIITTKKLIENSFDQFCVMHRNQWMIANDSQKIQLMIISLPQ